MQVIGSPVRWYIHKEHSFGGLELGTLIKLGLAVRLFNRRPDWSLWKAEDEMRLLEDSNDNSR